MPTTTAAVVINGLAGLELRKWKRVGRREVIELVSLVPMFVMDENDEVDMLY